jgi:putative hydrolase of the HAD superfamily
MIEAIVLDVGGVILRTEDRSGRQMLEIKYDLAPGGSEALVFNSVPAAQSTIGKVGQDQIWQNIANELNLTPAELNDFKHTFWQGDQIDIELIKYLEQQRGLFTTALLSNAWVGMREILADQYQIVEGKTVDHILISAELGVAKPDQRIYHILASTINCQFDTILFVDDFIENIVAANELGIQTIHYQPGMDLISHIQTKVDQN